MRSAPNWHDERSFTLTSPTPATRTPVVIVGAGPVGLCAALELDRRNIACLLLDRADSPPSDLRASTFHPPTLEMLESLGLAEPLLADGLKVPEWQVRLHATHGTTRLFRSGCSTSRPISAHWGGDGLRQQSM